MRHRLMRIDDAAAVVRDITAGERVVVRGQEGPRGLSVLILALGRAAEPVAAEIAETLGHRGASFTEDRVGTPTAAVLAVRAYPGGPAAGRADAETRRRLERRLRAADLVILVTDGSTLWDRFLTGGDPLLRRVRRETTWLVDIERPARQLAALIETHFGWRAHANIGADAAAALRQSTGVPGNIPQALMQGVLHHGLISVDWGDYRSLFAGQPLVLYGGLGRASGQDRGPAAAARALGPLRFVPADDVRSAYLAVGMTEDLALADFGAAVAALEQRTAGDAEILTAAPIAEGRRPLEVAVILAIPAYRAARLPASGDARCGTIPEDRHD